jgi:tetratricopeptide (TPR) repeat protein
MPHDVFISYSSIDKAAAFAACATFEAAKIRCWIAPRDVAAGSEWAEQIIEAIEAARVMVLIFSSNSNESRQVRREIELAVSRGLTIMPIRLEQIAPTKSMAYYMAGLHWLDALSPPLEAHFRQMIEWIRPHLGDAARPPPETNARVDTGAKPQPGPKAEPRTSEPPPQTAARPASGGWFEKLFGGGGSSAPAPRAPPPSPDSPFDLPQSGQPLPAIEGLTSEQDTLSGLFQIGLDRARQNRHDEAILAYRRLIIAFDARTEPIFRTQVVNAWYNAGNSFRALRRHEEAIAWFDAALERAGGRDEESIRETVARILYNKAASTDALGRKAAAIALYDELFARYGDDVDGVGRQLAERAIHSKAVISAELGRHDEALAFYDKFLARNANDPSQRVHVAEAMYNSGVSHGAKGRNEDAVVSYDRVIAMFRGETDPAINEYLAMALYNRGNRLADLQKRTEAIKSYDEVIATFGDDRRMPERIAKAMVNRANQLGGLGKKKEANAGYQAVIDKFGSHPDAAVQQQVTFARQWKN